MVPQELARASGPRLVLALAFGFVALNAACRDSVAPRSASISPASLTPRASFESVVATSSPTRDVTANGRRLDVLDDTAPPPRTRYRTEYHGGSVLTAVQDVYVIFYGSWPDFWTVPSKTETVISDFLTAIGNSPYFSTVARYTNASGNPANTAIIFGGAVMDDFSRGATLGDGDIEQIIQLQVQNFELPQDPNGIYVVITSPEVADTTGMFVTYCARHGTGIVYGIRTRYVVIGNPARSPRRCSAQPVGPNGTLDGDAIVSHLAAELANTMADPELNGWYDRLGLEPADKCVWTYGTTYRAANGAAANVRLGQRDYLLQQLWAPSKNGGSCLLRS